MSAAGVDIAAELADAARGEEERSPTEAVGDETEAVGAAAGAVTAVATDGGGLGGPVTDAARDAAATLSPSDETGGGPYGSQVGEPPGTAVAPTAGRDVGQTPTAAPAQARAETGVVEAEWRERVPPSVRYNLYVTPEVRERADAERGVRTWGEYLTWVLAVHAAELEAVFPDVRIDLRGLGVGFVTPRGHRRGDRRMEPVAWYLPRSDEGVAIAAVIEKYAARARSKSEFAQRLLEHHFSTPVFQISGFSSSG